MATKKVKQPEHNLTRLPLVEKLMALGWHKEQIVFEPEWRVPKSPSEAAKREKGQSYSGFPVDIAIFDSPANVGNWEHVLIIVETKAPNETSGISQLEIYMGLEPRAVLGIWSNGTETSALYRTQNGKFSRQRMTRLPSPSDNLLIAGDTKLKWADLDDIDAQSLRSLFSRLLDHVVSTDTQSTRRDDQLNQLCNLILIKLESDKKAKISPRNHAVFQVWKDEQTTGRKVRDFFETVKLTFSDLFFSSADQDLILDDDTIHKVCYELGAVRLISTSADAISIAFQVFRTASLKSEEGQYFTPMPVIRSAVRVMEVQYEDKIIDPACGTGGFLIESIRQFQEFNPSMDVSDIKTWSQRHIYGVDKDGINVKLTKAMMMILGDGSAHVSRGDSLRNHLWTANFQHLPSMLKDGSYTCVITNPPFGKNLTIRAKDLKASNLSIGLKPKKEADGSYSFSSNQYVDRPGGLVFVERCYNLLVVGGRLGIILPETYLFSSSYQWFQYWLDGRLELRGMFNIPMEAFQGFCRAKTNFYVFEKV